MCYFWNDKINELFSQIAALLHEISVVIHLNFVNDSINSPEVLIEIVELVVQVVNVLFIHVVSLTKSNFVIIEEALIASIKWFMSSISVSLLKLTVG